MRKKKDGFSSELSTEETIKLVKSSIIGNLNKIRITFDIIERKFNKFIADSNKANKLLVDSITKQEKLLKSVANISDNAEQTLLNVLLAIRQNEYLQAWYPAQEGEPETYVVGHHRLRNPQAKESKNAG